jgi:hypothetical protein
VGFEVGSVVGTYVGIDVGMSVGFVEGLAVGLPVGTALGSVEGVVEGVWLILGTMLKTFFPGSAFMSSQSCSPPSKTFPLKPIDTIVLFKHSGLAFTLFE